jgi:hypothetical protein
VLGRTVVLRSSSGCLNTGSCSFHLVAARGNQGGRMVQGRTLVLCYTGWCLYDWKLVLPSSWCWKHSGSWCFLLVGARETMELVLPSSWC